jgi:hypothetical protein
MKRTLSFFALTALLLTGCDKNPIIRQDAVATGARVKFVHAYPDGPATGVNVLVNDRKLNGGVPTAAVPVPALTFGSTFPSIGLDYAVVEPGNATVKVVVPATATTPEVVALTAPLTLEDNQYYSVIATGSPTPEALVLRDEFASVATNGTLAYARFLNLVPGTNYDIVVRGGATLATAIGYKAASPYFSLPAGPVVLDFRVPGTTTAVGSLTFNDLQPGRVYTFFTRGVVGRTGAQAPTLSNYRQR